MDLCSKISLMLAKHDDFADYSKIVKCKRYQKQMVECEIKIVKVRNICSIIGIVIGMVFIGVTLISILTQNMIILAITFIMTELLMSILYTVQIILCRRIERGMIYEHHQLWKDAHGRNNT